MTLPTSLCSTSLGVVADDLEGLTLVTGNVALWIVLALLLLVAIVRWADDDIWYNDP